LIHKRLIGVAVLAATGVLSSLPAGQVVASQASLRVAPHPIDVGRLATVTASNVHPNTVMFLLLTPDYQKPRHAQLMGYVRSNARGVVSQKVRVPLTKFCGGATITLFNKKYQKSVTARVTVSGCKVGPPSKVPPPPPAPSKPKTH